jgi:hypothetical protein
MRGEKIQQKLRSIPAEENRGQVVRRGSRTPQKTIAATGKTYRSTMRSLTH